MDLTKEKIAELKAVHREVYLCEYSWFDKNNQTHHTSFVYKKPLMANLEMFQKESEKSPATAQQNLLSALVVYPESSKIVAEISDYPSVIADFVTEEISPFFGKVAARKSSLL